MCTLAAAAAAAVVWPPARWPAPPMLAFCFNINPVASHSLAGRSRMVRLITVRAAQLAGAMQMSLIRWPVALALEDDDERDCSGFKSREAVKRNHHTTLSLTSQRMPGNARRRIWRVVVGVVVVTNQRAERGER